MISFIFLQKYGLVNYADQSTIYSSDKNKSNFMIPLNLDFAI